MMVMMVMTDSMARMDRELSPTTINFGVVAGLVAVVATSAVELEYSAGGSGPSAGKNRE